MARGFYWKLALGNLRNNRQVYLPYLISSTGVLMMFYIMASLYFCIGQEEMYGGATVAVVIGLGRIVIGVFAVLYLFYTNSFIMKRRKKELGLYNILGMEKRHISKIILRETVLTSLISISLGLGLGILFSKAMFLLFGKLLAVKIPITFTIPHQALTMSALLFAGIFLASMLYNIFQVRLSKPIELLHGGEVGEKEPKAHWLLSVLGVLSLGAGYFLAVSITSPLEALTWFFGAVILVIIGTYLLFITGITALLKLLKKKKNFYYKPNHFTTVSGMLYRMKQNAAGLASICILFTCLLVTVSTTFSLYTGMDGLIRVRYPRNIQIKTQGANDEAKRQITAAVEEVCKEQDVTAENVFDREYYYMTVARKESSFYLDGTFSNTYGVLEIYTLDEFARFSGQSVSLKENEILLSDPRHTFPDSPTLTINGVKFQAMKTDYDFYGGETAASVYETYYLVVPDEGFFRTVLEEGDAAPGFENHTVLLPQAYYSFDVSGGDTVIKQVAEALGQKLDSVFPAEGASYESLSLEDSSSSRQGFYSLYGGLFFVGLFLGMLFLLGTALIIYYKQVSEGYEDARRFSIMQNVGMSRDEVKKSIHSQILTVFFLPLLTAVLHLGFAFPMLQKILMLMNMVDFWLILGSTLLCVLVFGLIYAVIYLITAKTYYKIVETAEKG